MTKTEQLAKVIPYYQECDYVINIHLKNIDRTFNEYAEGYGGFEYNPDFQRGHVWTREQQIAYMESFTSNILSDPQKTITLNCPAFTNCRDDKPIELTGFVVVDGLQRLTAIQAFLNGEFKVFGKYSFDDLDGSRYSLKSRTIIVQVFSWKTKREILEYYLLFNTGGTVHSEQELKRVRGLLNECK